MGAWTVESLRNLGPDYWRAHMLLPEVVLEWFKVLGAGWVFEGDPKKPHAVLHSGKHSNGFFLCKRVLAFPNLRENLAGALLRALRQNLGQVDGVFGAPYSSILIAGDVGRMSNPPARTYVPEKDPADASGKGMIFKPDDPIPAGAILLQVEDLITTSDSAEATQHAIVKGNPNSVKFAPVIGTVIHRPPKLVQTLPDGRAIVALVQRQVDAWDPADCPLCKAGSRAVSPKSNWAELTAQSP